ncbi:MAG TPA: POTRA domain-containing protein, partial [Fimbriiglobus sp.]|nr:POTRA domain-containing protein [Fimbriiglobus sp.]
GGRQPPVGSLQQGADAPRSPELAEQFQILDEELTRLPDRLRGPVVVCLLQGRTQEQAVAELGGSVRTIRRRLEEAKQLLRLRLERRGVVPAVAAGLATGVGEATATVPADLPGRTVATVFDFLAGGAAVSAPVAFIAKGVAMGTLARKVKVMMVTAAVGLTALGVGVANGPPDPSRPEAPRASRPVGRAKQSDVAPLNTASDGGITVTGPNPVVVRAVANEAAYLRRALAVKWLGMPLPSDHRQTITISFGGPDHGNDAKVPFLEGKPGYSTLAIDYRGLEGFLEKDLPKMMTHYVLAEHFNKPIPRWAADGMAIQEMPEREQAVYDSHCREILSAGQAVPLTTLFPLKMYKQGVSIETQGHSVIRFLVATNGHQAVIEFIERGMRDEWDKPAKGVYGFDDVNALQKAWIEWMKTQPPMHPNWFKVRPKEPLPRIPPVTLARIPPVTLSGGQPVRAGTIVIEGNATVAQKVILDQLGLVPGKALDYLQLKKGRDNLIRLGVFDPDTPPAIDVMPRQDGSAFIDIRVRVKELQKDK